MAAAQRVWILGAHDPEMFAITKLISELGDTILYALDDKGQRVKPHNAYKTQALSEELPEVAIVLCVECGGPGVPRDAVVIDHHRPGDPGYGRPSTEFLSASSIGQVISQLARIGDGWDSCPLFRISRRYSISKSIERGQFSYEGYDGWCVGAWPEWYGARLAKVHIPSEIVLTAAADHCLAAAYRGECFGVDPDALMQWRVESRAKFQNRTVEDVLADVERARQALRSAPEIELAAGLTARDLRGQHIQELPEAAAREGLCFVADPLPGQDGRVKIVCQAGSPAQISAFMNSWAPAQGLIDVYGDPTRGLAGGYL